MIQKSESNILQLGIDLFLYVGESTYATYHFKTKSKKTKQMEAVV